MRPPHPILSPVPEASVAQPRPSRIHDQPPQSEKNAETPVLDGANGDTTLPQETSKFITSTSPTVVYLAVLLVFFVCSLEQQTHDSLFVYVLSYFSGHPAIAYTGMLTSYFSAFFIKSYTEHLKFGDHFPALILSVLWISLGLVILATSKSYVALVFGQAIYGLECQALLYILDVITCGISSLRNRAWLLALSRFPYIINTFVGPNLAQTIHRNGSWRLAYGTFGAILPVACAPLAVILFIEWRAKLIEWRAEAKANVEITRQRITSLPWWKFLGRIALAADMIGILLFFFGSYLFRALSVSSSSYEPVNSFTRVSRIVSGVLVLVSFVLWEITAPSRFAAFHLLLDSTVLGACFAGASLLASFYCLDAYFLSYIQVVYNMPISQAGYIYNIHTIGACCFAILAGISIRATGRFKWLAIGAMAWHLIATGLLLHFRQPMRNIAQIAISQFLISVSGGLLGICGQMAILAAETHTEPAIVLGLLVFFTNFGGAVGKTVASGIYTFYMPRALEKHLPADVKPWGNTIYRSIIQQLSYPMGSPIRQAIINSYHEVMRHLCVAGLAILPVALLSIAMWRNVNIKKAEQKQNESS